jgi:hypothetical protein
LQWEHAEDIQAGVVLHQQRQQKGREAWLQHAQDEEMKQLGQVLREQQAPAQQRQAELLALLEHHRQQRRQLQSNDLNQHARICKEWGALLQLEAWSKKRIRGRDETPAEQMKRHLGQILQQPAWRVRFLKAMLGMSQPSL